MGERGEPDPELEWREGVRGHGRRHSRFFPRRWKRLMVPHSPSISIVIHVLPATT